MIRLRNFEEDEDIPPECSGKDQEANEALDEKSTQDER
jgi:hypothetical protein